VMNSKSEQKNDDFSRRIERQISAFRDWKEWQRLPYKHPKRVSTEGSSGLIDYLNDRCGEIVRYAYLTVKAQAQLTRAQFSALVEIEKVIDPYFISPKRARTGVETPVQREARLKEKALKKAQARATADLNERLKDSTVKRSPSDLVDEFIQLPVGIVYIRRLKEIFVSNADGAILKTEMSRYVQFELGDSVFLDARSGKPFATMRIPRSSPQDWDAKKQTFTLEYSKDVGPAWYVSKERYNFIFDLGQLTIEEVQLETHSWIVD